MAAKRGPQNIFILGGNSPLGVELTKKFLSLGPLNVIVSYRSRNSAKALFELAETDVRVQPVELDLRASKFCNLLTKVSEIVGETGLNLFVNLAGIFTEKQSLCDFEKTDFMRFMEVNTISPLMAIKELLPLLVKGSEASPEGTPMGMSRAMIVNITSSYGSIEENSDGKYYMTRCCRAAMNAATKTLAVDLFDKKIIVVALHPGVQRTECAVPLESSAEGLLWNMQNLEGLNSGKAYDFSGKEIPW